jgi:hypothetical protein
MFAMAVPLPLRPDFDAEALRRVARRSRDAAQARRLLTLAAIYDGGTRSEAAKIGGVTLQIVRDRRDPRRSDPLTTGDLPEATGASPSPCPETQGPPAW